MMMNFPTSFNPLLDPYAVLGLPRSANDGEVKRAYFQMVRQFPPEKEPERFQEIRTAYDRIRTRERRDQTDLFLLQSPPDLPNRRRPTYDLTVHGEDAVSLAAELRLAQLRVEDDFRLPEIPTS